MGRLVTQAAGLTRLLAGLAALLAASYVATAQTGEEEPATTSAEIAPLATTALMLGAVRIDGRIVAVGDQGIIVVSTDGGENWAQSEVPTRSMLTSVWFHNTELGWAVGHDAAILKTTDGGATWRLVNFQPDLLLPLFDVWFADEQRGMAVGPYGFVLTTDDGGETWEEGSLGAQPLPAAGDVVEEDVVGEDLESAEIVDAGEEEEDAEGEDVGSAEVVDAGEEEEDPFWEGDFEGGEDFHLNKIAQGTDGRLYIAAEGGKVYRSDDGGETWFSLPSDYTGSYFSAIALPEGAMAVMGMRGTIFRTTDRGATWQQLDTPVQTSLNHAAVTADGAIVVVGMSGTILVSKDGGESFSLVQREDRKAMTSIVAKEDGGVILFGEGGIVPLGSGEF